MRTPRRLVTATAAMGFKKALAEAFARDIDRDRALYFAGRVSEIASFDARLAMLVERLESGDAASSLAMVFQGPPGCGKTSLVDHLGKRHPDVLFVRAEKRHVARAGTLMERIRQMATAAGMLGVGKRAFGLVAQAVGAKELARSANDMIGNLAAARSRIVVHVDEAQTLDAGQEEGLLAMQQGTLDVAVLPVFTGLSHTASSLRAVPGLSRLAAGSAVNMAGLDRAECVASTRSMLKSMGAIGDDDELADASRFVADLSRGWPQHLNRAQAALCRELVRAEGHVGAIDRNAVQRQSDQSRYAYYRSRLDDPVLAVRPGLAAALASKLAEDRAYDLMSLADLCAAEMARLGINAAQWFEPRDYVRAMIERGVLAQDGEDEYAVAIPSMKDWLVATYRA